MLKRLKQRLSANNALKKKILANQQMKIDNHDIKKISIGPTNSAISYDDEFRALMYKHIDDPGVIDQLLRDLTNNQIKEFVLHYNDEYKNILKKMANQKYSVDRFISFFKDMLLININKKGII